MKKSQFITYSDSFIENLWNEYRLRPKPKYEETLTKAEKEIVQRILKDEKENFTFPKGWTPTCTDKKLCGTFDGDVLSESLLNKINPLVWDSVTIHK